MAKVDTHGLTIKGLKKASGQTHNWGYYSGHYVEIFYSPSDCEVWTKEQFCFGHHTYTVYSDKSIIKVGIAYSHWTQQEIADAIYNRVTERSV